MTLRTLAQLVLLLTLSGVAWVCVRLSQKLPELSTHAAFAWLALAGLLVVAGKAKSPDDAFASLATFLRACIDWGGQSPARSGILVIACVASSWAAYCFGYRPIRDLTCYCGSANELLFDGISLGKCQSPYSFSIWQLDDFSVDFHERFECRWDAEPKNISLAPSFDPPAKLKCPPPCVSPLTWDGAHCADPEAVAAIFRSSLGDAYLARSRRPLAQRDASDDLTDAAATAPVVAVHQGAAFVFLISLHKPPDASRNYVFSTPQYSLFVAAGGLTFVARSANGNEHSVSVQEGARTFLFDNAILIICEAGSSSSGSFLSIAIGGTSVASADVRDNLGFGPVGKTRMVLGADLHGKQAGRFGLMHWSVFNGILTLDDIDKLLTRTKRGDLWMLFLGRQWMQTED